MNKGLESAIKSINDIYGKGSIGTKDQIGDMSVRKCSTGSIEVDRITSGGLPYGRITEVIGPESSGKTTLCLQAIREAQKEQPDKACVFVDVEQALDLTYAESLGIDTDKLIIVQPTTAEETIDITVQLLNSNGVSVLVCDSIAAMVPKKRLEGHAGESAVADLARLMSLNAMKMVNGAASSGTALVFTNQIREKVGVMFGSPETTPGGNAIKFYASLRVDVRRSSQIKDGEDVIGNVTKLKVIKSKVGPPFMKAEVEVYYGKGIWPISELLKIATEEKIIKKAGSWFSYGDVRIGQGRNAALLMLQDNEELCEEIRLKLQQECGN